MKERFQFFLHFLGNQTQEKQKNVKNSKCGSN